MSALLTTLFIVMLLPFLAKAPLVVAMSRQSGGYDNHNPRAQQKALEGFGERANAAHYNSFEALGVYSAAVLAAVAAGQCTNLRRFSTRRRTSSWFSTCPCKGRMYCR